MYDIKCNEHAAGQPQTEAEEVDERRTPIFPEIAECGFEIIPEHGLIQFSYSVLRLFTGLATAARIA
jgi:hypothetical protein